MGEVDRYELMEVTVATADKTTVWRPEVGWMDENMWVLGSASTDHGHENNRPAS